MPPAAAGRPYSDRMRAGAELAERLPSTRAAALSLRGGMAPALIASAVAAVAALLGSPVVWLVASVVAVALALGRGTRAWVEALPGGAVLLVATTMSFPLVAGLFGADVLDGTPA